MVWIVKLRSGKIVRYSIIEQPPKEYCYCVEDLDELLGSLI